jgi:SOS response regulatory protein OraA/RecX
VVLTHYRETGHIDDAAYAEGQARSWHGRGAPSTQIRFRRIAEGVDEAVAGVTKLAAEAADLDLDLLASAMPARPIELESRGVW